VAARRLRGLIRPNGYTVTATSALGRTRSFQVEQLSTGALRRTTVEADGTKTINVTAPDGSEQITDVTGTVSTIVHGPDPRWGMLASNLNSVTVSTPGGRHLQATSTVTTTLADPANPLSASTRVENGHAQRTDTQDDVHGEYTHVHRPDATRQAGESCRRRAETTDARLLSGLQPISFAYDSHGLLASSTEGSGADDAHIDNRQRHRRLYWQCH
jgi:hypothetical protein